MTRLIPNLGAEETQDWARFSGNPAVRRAISSWRLIFAPGNRLIGTQPIDEVWPESLGPRADRAAFAWLDGLASAAWLADADAHRLASQQEAPLSAPAPDVVLAVHDKAFALEAARELGEEPRTLRGLCHAFAPRSLEDGADPVAQIESALADWPQWTRGLFTLKPRLGSSGRGRVAGRREQLDADAIRRALPRLASRGGALLEPWLERTRDLSVVMHVTGIEALDTPAITILGSLEQRVSQSGVYHGHLGEIDSRGRVFSGSSHDEPMRAAAAALAARARDAGYAGPCGADGFAFRVPQTEDEPAREVLRPIVELNARFTMGIIAVGLIRRALAGVKRDLGLEPGERLAFLFALECPENWSSWEMGRSQLGERSLLLPLAPASDSRGPALIFSERLASIRQALAVPGRPG